MAKMGTVQRSVANSHQTDYPGRATPICSLILPTDKRLANSDKVPFQFPLQFLLVIQIWTFEYTLLGLVCIIQLFSRRKIMSLTTFHSLCMAHNRGSLLAAFFWLWPCLWIDHRILDLRFYRYHRVCALRTPSPSFN